MHACLKKKEQQRTKEIEHEKIIRREELHAIHLERERESFLLLEEKKKILKKKNILIKERKKIQEEKKKILAGQAREQAYQQWLARKNREKRAASAASATARERRGRRQNKKEEEGGGGGFGGMTNLEDAVNFDELMDEQRRLAAVPLSPVPMLSYGGFQSGKLTRATVPMYQPYKRYVVSSRSEREREREEETMMVPRKKVPERWSGSDGSGGLMGSGVEEEEGEEEDGLLLLEESVEGIIEKSVVKLETTLKKC